MKKEEKQFDNSALLNKFDESCWNVYDLEISKVHDIGLQRYRN